MVAARFGWSAVADRPMEWTEYQAALQLMAEERVGRAVREQAAQEDAEFAAARSMGSRIRG